MRFWIALSFNEWLWLLISCVPGLSSPPLISFSFLFFFLFFYFGLGECCGLDRTPQFPSSGYLSVPCFWTFGPRPSFFIKWAKLWLQFSLCVKQFFSPYTWSLLLVEVLIVGFIVAFNKLRSSSIWIWRDWPKVYMPLKLCTNLIWSWRWKPCLDRELFWIQDLLRFLVCIWIPEPWDKDGAFESIKPQKKSRIFALTWEQVDVSNWKEDIQ